MKKSIGRRQTPKEVRESIFRMVVENPTWGAPRLRNLENQSSAFETVKPAQSRQEGGRRVRLVFHRYDNEYFLAVVSAGSWESTYDFQISKEENLLADASPIKQQKVASVLPNGNVQTADVDQE